MREFVGFDRALYVAIRLVGDSRIARHQYQRSLVRIWTPNALAMRRDEHDRHTKKVARIQCPSDRLLWASNVLVRSLQVR